MTLEMQRLYLKEILDELSNYNRILNDDCSRVNEDSVNRLVAVHSILTSPYPLNVPSVGQCSSQNS